MKKFYNREANKGSLFMNRNLQHLIKVNHQIIYYLTFIYMYLVILIRHQHGKEIFMVQGPWERDGIWLQRDASLANDKKLY